MQVNDITMFESEQFGEIRTVVENDQVLFCAKDVCGCLGYSNSRKAIVDHCKGVTNRYPLQTPGGIQDFVFITESDVMRLIVSSKLPSAQKFEVWVFENVLPSIRSHGGYLTPKKIEEALLNPDTIIRLATDLKVARERCIALETKSALDTKVISSQVAKIDHMRPKALFADAVATSDSTILIGDLAKIIKQSCGVDTGQKRLFDWMRINGWLMKDGSSKNMPTQKAMEMGLFRIKETTISNPDGSVRVTKTTKVTGKGQQHFVNLFANMASERAS